MTETLIQAGMGKNAIRDPLKQPSYIRCVIELIKNTRDYTATEIAIITGNPDFFTIIDNGEGMDAEGRGAFISLDMSTKRKSGKFGSGAKKMLVSHALHVTVKSVSSKEPDKVCIFTLTEEEFVELVRTQGVLPAQILPKTPDIWPHDFPTGTEITFKLRDKKRKCILRGEELATELSVSLPCHFEDILKVDGVSIPSKKVIGQIWRKVIEHPELGTMLFEFYRPEKKTPEDMLRLTSEEIGEATFASFYRVLSPALRKRIPDVFHLVPDVCGRISIAYFREYATENREVVLAEIGDDPRTIHFIELLRKIAPAVKRALKLEADSYDKKSVDSIIQDITDMYGSVYGTIIDTEDNNGQPPIPDDEDDDGDGPEPREPKPLRLHHRGEYEVGETVDVRLYMSDKTSAAFRRDEVKWQWHGSCIKDAKITGTGMRFTAVAVGQAIIRAEIPSTPYQVKTKFDVVESRRLKLNIDHLTVTQGSCVVIKAINADKIKGDSLIWTTNGQNSLIPQENHRVYQADRVEEATITVRDSNDPNNMASCTITVRPRANKVIRIKTHKFRMNRLTTPDLKSNQMQPVKISPGNDIHDLFISPHGRGYTEAESRGEIMPFLNMAVAIEYASFVNIELGGHDHSGEYSFIGLLEKIRLEALEVFSEVSRGSKKPKA